MPLTPVQLFYYGVSTLPGLLYAVLYLAGLNQYLTTHNIIDPYFSVQQQYPPNVVCTPADQMYRSADGHCNDYNITAMGSKGTRFGRTTYYPQQAVVADAMNSSIFLEPNPILVSNLLSRQTDSDFIASPNLNVLAAAWIQFNIHDWFNHVQDEKAERIYVPDPTNPTKTAFSLRRTARDASGFAVNDNTHWWDASQLYGSDIQTQNHVRTHECGKLKEGIIEPTTKTIVTGFNQNWWVGLSLVHRLFISEHNYLCDQLLQQHPTWTDEQLFQHARLLISATIAKIHHIEWATTLLENAPAQFGLNTDWYGIAHLMQLYGITTAQLLAIGLTPQQIAGLSKFQGVGHVKDVTIPQFMPEEFVTIYRMHPLLPDYVTPIMLDPTQGTGAPQSKGKTYGLFDVAFKGADRAIEKEGIVNWLTSFGVNPAGHLKFGNYPSFFSNLQLPQSQGGLNLNMAAVDILRDRERLGIRYNEFRRQLGLAPLASWNDLALDNTTSAALSDIYGGDLEKLDILPGILAEANWPAGYAISSTTFWIFTFITPRRLGTDRFFQESFNNETYTPWGLQYVQTTFMKDVLKRHHPQLIPILDQTTGSVFAPWNQTQTTPVPTTNNNGNQGNQGNGNQGNQGNGNQGNQGN